MMSNKKISAMPRLRWIVPQKLIYFKPAPNADMAMVTEDNRALADMLKSVPSSVNLIVDATGVNLFPGDLQMIRNSHAGIDYANITWIIAINVNPLGKFIGNMLAQVYRKQIRYVDNLESALAFLKQVDLSLRDVAEL